MHKQRFKWGEAVWLATTRIQSTAVSTLDPRWAVKALTRDQDEGNQSGKETASTSIQPSQSTLDELAAANVKYLSDFYWHKLNKPSNVVIFTIVLPFFEQFRKKNAIPWRPIGSGGQSNKGK